MRPDRPTTESDGIRRLQRPSSSAVQLMSRSFSPPAHQHTPIPRGHSMPPSPPLAAATSSRASKASIARHIMNGCTSAVRNAQAPRLSLQSQRVHRAVRVLETLQSSESAQAGGATSTSHEHRTRCHGAAVVHPARLEASQLGGSACVGRQRRPAGLVRGQPLTRQKPSKVVMYRGSKRRQPVQDTLNVL